MSGLRGKRILAVEDEAIIALMLEEMLVELGAHVIGPASSIAAALAFIESEPVDAAVLDVNIRSDRIDPVASRLRAQNIPFVFATGYGQAAATSTQGEQVLEKPYTLESLSAALQLAIARRTDRN